MEHIRTRTQLARLRDAGLGQHTFQMNCNVKTIQTFRSCCIDAIVPHDPALLKGVSVTTRTYKNVRTYKN